ncbi:hypothetical protein [Kutzneria albida]|uniref:Uncharacterized protein n=1 Tax=Kutzneria albida DSM 43870 TaxID=1449976 RepID=W5WCG7_9PSEU|nr:hypothetical protein [Kutzneria albida]AHH98587.1 hypothetical protein KALB_5225 [Kutzneria albida DSM 43870]
MLITGLAPEEVERLGQAYLTALADDLSADPDRFGLRHSLERAGHALVDLLEAINRHGPAFMAPLVGDTAEERRDAFVAHFTNHVTDSVGLTVDAVVRQVAADTAQTLLDQSPRLRSAVESGVNSGAVIDNDVFCAIYNFFFADAVTTFLRSVIAAKITLLVPVLPAVDPAGHIAGWIADKLTAVVPTPCQRQGTTTNGSSLADLGRSMVKEAVERVLGLPAGGQS